MSAQRRLAPSILDEIAQVIGDEASLKLIEAFGGKQFWVPRRPGPDHPITAAIGATAAAAFGDYWHGQTIALPHRQSQRRRIRALADADNLSGDEIARRLHLPRSTVYRVLAETQAANERDLFD